MITINSRGKQWKNASDEEKMGYCDSLLETDKAERAIYDWEWYMNKMFLDGHHYVYYNSVTNSLERPPRKRGEVRAVVNKLRAVNRAIRNYITRLEPKWEVIPGDLDEDTITNARRSGKLLDYVYRLLHLEGAIGGIVDSILNCSVGWVELDWDENAHDGMGEVMVKLHDTFDIWIPRGATFYAGKLVSHHLAKTVRKTLDEIAADERYNEKTRKKVQKDAELATSSMKARIIRKEYGFSDTEKIEGATVKEFMLWDAERNDKKGNLQLFTYAGGQVLRDEAMKLTEYPIYGCQIQLEPRTVYQRSWNSDGVALNKILDRTFSQKVMYVNQALIYRIIAEKGHGATPVPLTNEMGEVIEINKGRKFEQVQMFSLPTTLDSLNAETNNYIETVLGAHEATWGSLPAGARSGDMLEALQAADSNNLHGLRQSLESFLSVLGKAILKIISEKYVASRVIRITEPEMEEGQSIYNIEVTGKKSPKKEGATIVTGEDEVIVKMGSWLGYTQEAQRETLLKLGELGVVPGDEVLRQFEFPNINELSKKAKEQRLEQHQLDAEIAGRTQAAQGAQAPAGPGGIDTVALADKENTAMINGQVLPPTEGADMPHSQAHIDFTKTRYFVEAGKQIQMNFQTHVQGELQAQGLGGR